MPNLTAGQSATIDIPTGMPCYVSTTQDAYVDLVAGAPGSGYTSDRLVGGRAGKLYGPWTTPAKITIRSVLGTATYGGAYAGDPIDLGQKSAAAIVAINAAIAAGTASYPAASTVVNTDTGARWTLSGLGTAAAFAVDGAGNVEIVNNLETSSSTSALSARQGVVIAGLLSEKAGLVASKNLINPSDPGVAVGFYPEVGASGALFANASYVSTGFVRVDGGGTYTISVKHHVAWYNSAYGFIRGTTGSDTNRTFVAPANAAYLRASFSTANWGLAQLEVGSAKTSYVPFGSRIPGNLVEDESIDFQHLKKKAVRAENANFFKSTKNLFNKFAAVPGYYIDNNANVAANPVYCYSDFIPVTPGQVYSGVGGPNNMRFVCYFDGTKTLVPGGASSGSTSFTTPVGVAFVRISVGIDYISTFQMETGSVATEYVKYGYIAELPDGTPIFAEQNVQGIDRPSVFGLEYMRETRQRLRKIKLAEGINRLTIAAIGDSWTHNTGRWPLPFSTVLKNAFGNGGQGWIGFGGAGGAFPNGSVISTSLLTFVGAWSSVYGSATGPDICRAQSSTAGDSISYNYDPLTRPADAVSHIYFEGGAGVVRYKYGAGGWTGLDLTSYAAGVQVVQLTGAPTSGSSVVFTVEVVSGTPVLYGVNEVSAALGGIVMHKLGATGTSSAQWAAVNAAAWQVGFAALAANLTIIMHGTNDQTSQSAAQYAANIGAICDRVRAARPSCDLLIVVPCENARGLSITMSSYAAAAYAVAKTKKAGFIDLQPVFGDAPADYAAGSARPWFAADGIHPDPLTGGRAIVDILLRSIVPPI